MTSHAGNYSPVRRHTSYKRNYSLCAILGRRITYAPRRIITDNAPVLSTVYRLPHLRRGVISPAFRSAPMFPFSAVWEVACFQGSAPSHLPPVRLLQRPALSRFGSRSAFVSACVSVAHRGGFTRSPTPAFSFLFPRKARHIVCRMASISVSCVFRVRFRFTFPRIVRHCPRLRLLHRLRYPLSFPLFRSLSVSVARSVQMAKSDNPNLW